VQRDRKNIPAEFYKENSQGYSSLFFKKTADVEQGRILE